MVFIDNLLPRYDIPLQNIYDLINNSNDDFHFIIYYLDDYKMKIIVRRLDDNCGWGVDLKFRLYDNDKNKFEIISIGSSYTNSKIINIYTTIKLYKIKYQLQKIPKLIFQTMPSQDIDNILHHNSILSFIELNPEYEYKIYNDIDQRLFIKNNFDTETLYAYDLLVAGAFKADFFRYCYLYINGGCYFDCKQILRKPLRMVINADDSLLLCDDIDIGYFNAVMMSVKKNNNIYSTIELCKNKIFNFNRYYNIHDKNFGIARTILSLTGPVLLYEALHTKINIHNVRFKHKHKHNIHEYQRLLVDCNNELIITKNYKGYNCYGKSHYSTLWTNLEILYKNIIIINNYKFFIYPYIFNDKYNIHILNNNSIIVERIDTNTGWDNNLKIKLIDEKNNKMTDLNIGKSLNKFKIINFDENIFDLNIFIESYTYDNTVFDDVFDIFFIECSNVYKIVVIRLDKEYGWCQDLKINFKLLNNHNNYSVNIGNSIEKIKIIEIGYLDL